ncbi:MAG: hypothetical protein ACYTDY_03805 [Planctomycetota bacterium]|jgi:hypothetical protein
MTEKAELTDQEILERIAEWTVRRRLTAPAIVFLEAHRPLSFVGSQAMIAASPIVSFFEPFFQMLAGTGYDHTVYERFARMLEERRETVELLIIEIERKNQEQRALERDEKRRRKALRREAKEKRRALRQARREGDS